MLHQYNQNDINREPQLLKKWLTNKVNETKKEKDGGFIDMTKEKKYFKGRLYWII